MTVEIKRRLPAPIDEVFRWWTEPDRMAAWMTPAGTAEVQIDLRVGGTLRVVMRGDGMVIEHDGRYLEIDPPRRLSFTWTSVYTGSKPTMVTVELQPDGEDATQLRLVHEELSEDASRSHYSGWSMMLARLAGALETVYAG